MTTQLERLQQDIEDLAQYIQKLEQRGNRTAVTKMTKKMSFLKSYAAEKQLAI